MRTPPKPTVRAEVTQILAHHWQLFVHCTSAHFAAPSRHHAWLRHVAGREKVTLAGECHEAVPHTKVDLAQDAHICKWTMDNSSSRVQARYDYQKETDRDLRLAYRTGAGGRSWNGSNHQGYSQSARRRDRPAGPSGQKHSAATNPIVFFLGFEGAKLTAPSATA